MTYYFSEKLNFNRILCNVLTYFKARSYGLFAIIGAANGFSFSLSLYFKNSDIIPSYLLFIFMFGWMFCTLLDQRTDKKKIISSFIYLVFMHATALSWIVYPLTINFQKHWFLIPVSIMVIPMYISCFLLISTICIIKFKKLNLFSLICLFTITNSIITYLYGHYCPGFPWVLPGYIWMNNIYCIQILSVCGIWGLNAITFLLIAMCGGIFYLFETQKLQNIKKILISFAGVIAFLYLYGVVRIYNNNDINNNTLYKARIVQCNLSQKNKMDKAQSFANLKNHLDMSKHEGHCDFIIWPEASIAYLYQSNNRILNKYLSSVLNNVSELIIIGAIREDKNSKIYNSAIVVDFFGNNILCYDKQILVPFGEYVPFRKFLPFSGIACDIDDFDIGITSKIINIKGLKILMAICYEAIFSNNHLYSSENCDVLLNLTNDAWFGDTFEPYQHLNIVKARAVEIGIPIIRCTNYGISAVFDSYGIERGKIDINVSGVLDFYIPKKTQATLFSKYGDNIFWIFLIALFLCIISSLIKSNVKNTKI